ncbi:MAG TPA: hypothetical protein VFN87_05540 [Solirubrobacteraceae bacterium]|nr:hypothetical protein [Solirubrobacteraceae bacterium]
MAARRQRILAAAQTIITAGGRCLVEACADVPTQRWEPCRLVLSPSPHRVLAAVLSEIELNPTSDLRLTGCCPRTLRPLPETGAHLCHLAPTGRCPSHWPRPD